MNRFTRLILELDRTNKSGEKLAAIERYFQEAPAADAAWAITLLSGQRLKRALKTGTLVEAALRATGVPAWLFDECVQAVGDLSETIALLLPERAADGGGTVNGAMALHQLIEERILPLARLDDERGVALLMDTWAALGPDERFVFNKLVRGNFRLGVQRRMIVRALASAKGLDADLLEHRLSGGFKPTVQAYVALTGAQNDADLAARPYPFCLAQQLDDPPETLGDIAAWQVELKWDGIRAQVLRRKAAPVALWSRGEELVTGQFPEVATAAVMLPEGTVLDGEILAWDFSQPDGPTARPLSFNDLQQRLNRKHVQPGLFDARGVAFVAFDVLEHAGVDVRGTPLRERLTLLRGVVAPLTARTGGVLRLPPTLSPAGWSAVAEIRHTARERYGAEGVMIKLLESRYHVGRIAGGSIEKGAEAGWWKWKTSPYAVDAVLIYAQPGTGKRAGLFSDQTFGVWDPAPPPAPGARLVPFAKAYSGLTNEELSRVDRFIRANTTGRTGPVRMVAPELVFEIAFEGIQESTRHASGIAVRFPRIARWRTDKTAAQADTIATLRGLLRQAERGAEA